MTRAEILKEAEKCVCTDREGAYGSPESNFKLIADLWETYLNARCAMPDNTVIVVAEDVANMMALLKIARIATGKFKDDSYIDACGYIACAGEIAGNGNG